MFWWINQTNNNKLCRKRIAFGKSEGWNKNDNLSLPDAIREFNSLRYAKGSPGRTEEIGNAKQNKLPEHRVYRAGEVGDATRVQNPRDRAERQGTTRARREKTPRRGGFPKKNQ